MNADTLSLAKIHFQFKPPSWAYVDTGATRDLRLDFMRGLVIPLMISAHFDYLSLLMYVGWERIGVVSSACIFVTLSGIVIGMVYGKKFKRDGFEACLYALFSRANQLYRVNLFIILTIGLLRYVPHLNTTVLTTFHDPYRNLDFPLYPAIEDGFFKLFSDALLLRCGPHQFQVIGLYVTLFAFVAPFVFWMLEKRQVNLLMGISWGLYFINFGTLESQPATAEIRLIGAQFEFAFPLIAWQLIFVHGILIGYYKQELLTLSHTSLGKFIIWCALVLTFGFIIFTLNHPMDQLVSWSKLSFISPDTFNYLYFNYFQKYKLGPGRLINMTVLLLSSYVLLTVYWQPLNRVLGGFFIPLGQASLYVFFVHVFLLLLVSNTPFPTMHNFGVNTVMHIVVLATIWIMVKKEFLFRWIPR